MEIPGNIINTALYIHIPFCKKRCIYCNFLSTTQVHLLENYIHCLCKELQDRKDYLPPHSIKTIYFGGGTPSLLPKNYLEKLFRSLEDNQYYENGKEYEITLEVNPNDVSKPYTDIIQSFPFNRISIGIQSFQTSELQWIRREYHAETALRSVRYFQQLNYQNISIDLLYGLPVQSLPTWKKTLEQAIRLNVPHISAYHLSYEKNTLLYNWLQKNKIHPIEEETSLKMTEMLRNTLVDSGLEQYEISNFALSGHASKHNISYWNGNYYLGIGASAHSYNGKSRQYNKVQNGNVTNYKPEIENIDKKTAYNDFIITRLRTIQGISLIELELRYGQTKKEYCLYQAQKYLTRLLLKRVSDHLRLTPPGIQLMDEIICDLLN